MHDAMHDHDGCGEQRANKDAERTPNATRACRHARLAVRSHRPHPGFWQKPR